ATRPEALVELVVLGGDVCEALALRKHTAFGADSLTEVVLLCQPGERGGAELGLPAETRRVRERRPGGLCLQLHARKAIRGREEDGRLGEERSSARAVPQRSHAYPVAQRGGDRRPPTERLGSQDDELPFRQLRQHADGGPRERALARAPLDDRQVSLLPGGEELEIDAGATD